SSKSLEYSQEITSTEQEPERPGRSLVTTDHDVIQQWAQERDAVPATVEGTEHGDHLGVLRFDFPGGSESGRLREVSGEEWFDTFDLHYYAAQLFVLSPPPVDGGRNFPPLLEIARFAAPAVTVYALIEAGRRLFAAELARLRTRRTRGHDVVCGDSPVAYALTA